MPKGVYDRSKAKPRGYWKEHGGEKAKNQHHQRKKTKKGFAGGTFEVPAPETNGHAPKPKRKYTRRHVAGAEALASTVRPAAQAEAVAAPPPEAMPKDFLIRLVDSIAPEHVKALDAEIADSMRRVEALKLLRKVAAAKCGLDPVLEAEEEEEEPPAAEPAKPRGTQNKNSEWYRDPSKALPPWHERPENQKPARPPKPEPDPNINSPPPAPPKKEDIHIPIRETPVRTEKDRRAIDRGRVVIGEFLMEKGNAMHKPMFLMAHLGLSGKLIREMCDHEWFERRDEGLTLTAKGLERFKPKPLPKPEPEAEAKPPKFPELGEPKPEGACVRESPADGEVRSLPTAEITQTA